MYFRAVDSSTRCRQIQELTLFGSGCIMLFLCSLGIYFETQAVNPSYEGLVTESCIVTVGAALKMSIAAEGYADNFKTESVATVTVSLAEI
jgi:hypothetical protein